jgi:hypothetical protein
VLEQADLDTLDEHAASRLRAMLERYRPVIERERARAREEAGDVGT